MQRIVRWLVFSFLLVAPALARQTKDVTTLNREALEAITAKKYDEGIALLQKILELTPKDKGTAYNLACVCSLKGDVEKAHEWLSTAADWGWGGGRGSIAGSNKQMSELDMCRNDADLANLRKDPRFEALMAKMALNVEKRAALQKQVDEYAKTAAVYVPEAVKGLAEMPLLVVLHDAGSNKDAVVAGRWKAIADELGFALVAPSATVPVGSELAQGLEWFDDIAAYAAKTWVAEKPITDATSAFMKEHTVDKRRVLIAGEGRGGIVASSVAFTNPGLYKGVLMLDSLFLPQLVQARAANASKIGLKVRILVDGPSLRDVPEGDDLKKRVEEWNRALATMVVQGGAEQYVADRTDAAKTQALVVAALRGLLPPAAAPADAPSGK